MYLGLKCVCGHEFFFQANEVEFLVKGAPMIRVCSKCDNEVFIVRTGGYLASYRIVDTEGDSKQEGQNVTINYDQTPLSICGLPEI